MAAPYCPEVKHPLCALVQLGGTPYTALSDDYTVALPGGECFSSSVSDNTFGDIYRSTSEFEIQPIVDDKGKGVLGFFFNSPKNGRVAFKFPMTGLDYDIEYGKFKGSEAERAYEALNKTHYPSLDDIDTANSDEEAGEITSTADKNSKSHRHGLRYISLRFTGLPLAALSPTSFSSQKVLSLPRYEIFRRKLHLASLHRQTVTILAVMTSNEVAAALYRFGETAPIPFYTLTAELRVWIWELLYRFPDTGILWRDGGQAPLIRTDDAHQLFSVVGWDSALLHGHTKEERLYSLSVAVYWQNEGFVVFYGTKHFHCTSMAAVKNLLSIDAAKKHIKHLSIDYDLAEAADPTAVTSALKLLKGMSALSELWVRIKEAGWAQMGQCVRGKARKKYQDPLKIPGVYMLGGVRGLREVKFMNCPTIATAIAKDMKNPKTKSAK